jgi:AcrR family transcriptional regulator
MTRRAEQMDATRQRIIDATVELHGSIGLAATTIAAIAERSGVTRLTVYRHFPDETTLMGACSAQWMSQQQPPDPGAWSRIADPAERLRAGLADLYRFYRAGAGMLANVYRDFAVLPEALQQALRDQDNHHRDVLVEPFRGRTSDQLRRLRAVVGHAVSFWTWRSLCVDHGLSDQEAVEAITVMILTSPQPPDAAWLKLGAEPGLCGACEHAKLNHTRRDTAYLRCTRAAWDAALVRYPRLPVTQCAGFEQR